LAVIQEAMFRTFTPHRGFPLALGLAFVCGSMSAQDTGHYIEGATGLDNGTLAPPGLYFQYLPYVYKIDSVKGANGNTLLRLKNDFTLRADNLVLSAVLPVKFLGADYSASVIVPLLSQRIQSDAIPGGSFQNYGVSDIYISPLTLGWHLKAADVLFNWGIYAPAGSYDPNKLSNVGLGFWENQFQLGSTVHLDHAKTISLSALTTWEINGKKIDSDDHPGEMFTIEYGLGKTLLKGGLKLGVSGAFYRKLTPDRGSAISTLAPGIIDQSMQIGPEAVLTLPVSKTGAYMSLLFRFQPQFDVVAKTRGEVFVFGLAFFSLFHHS
jgi:hypothetical protein